MSRILKVMIVLLAITAMVAPAVFAEDRLALSGEMRVRGWYIDDENASADNTNTYADQRFRLMGKLSVAEGVNIVFRTDITDGVWGNQAVTSGIGKDSATKNSQEWDRAFIDLTKDSVNLQAGQLFTSLGAIGTFNAQSNGLILNVKGPVAVQAFYMLNNNDNDATVADDTYAGLQISHSSDVYTGKLFIANDQADAKDIYVYGVSLNYKLDAINLTAEFDYFSGDATATNDAVGTQFYLDGNMAVSEAITVGAEFFYAKGNDDATDDQIAFIGNDAAGWDPLFDVGTGLSNEDLGLGRPFELDTDSGVVAGRLYLKGKATDELSYGASIAYGEPEEDSVTTVDSVMAYAAGLSYAVMANTSLDLQVEYIDVDETGTEEVLQGGMGLFVKF